MFNKDTFFSDIKVSSFYLHDTRACEKYKMTEGESGWAMQGVVSKAAFRRQPRHGSCLCTSTTTLPKSAPSGRSFFSKFALSCRMSTGDFNGASWRQSSGNSPQPTPMPPAPAPLWCPGAVPGEWADVCGLIKLPNSHDVWKIRLHGL